jgi:hypothetical protein
VVPDVLFHEGSDEVVAVVVTLRGQRGSALEGGEDLCGMRLLMDAEVQPDPSLGARRFQVRGEELGGVEVVTRPLW